MIRTLVVDDDFRVADLHCAYVERIPGFQVIGRAHAGGEALRDVEQLQPDLVLLDIYLPDMSGLEVLQHLREEEKTPVDVIAITAARDVDSLRAAITVPSRATWTASSAPCAPRAPRRCPKAFPTQRLTWSCRRWAVRSQACRRLP